MAETKSHPVIHEALTALTYAATLFDKSVEPQQLSHRLGRVDGLVDSLDICRCAGWISLRAKQTRSSIDRLHLLPTPALLHTQDGWMVLLSADSHRIRLYAAGVEQIREYSAADFAKQWCGDVILLAEAGLRPEQVKFGFGWFIPSIRKHIRQFRRVIYVSLMIQLIALVTPMLLENVIDRVLVSRSLNSLQVLGIAMLALAVAEPLYGFMRGWLFSQLSSKVNASLSARLYEHLIGLPLRYFGQRQTGQIIARVQEMEHIRQFLTGSALTMVLDLAFIGLFIAVMFCYAAQLSWLVLGTLAIYFLFWISVGPGLRNRVNRQFELGADNTAFLTETVMGVETIKTSATEPRFQNIWENSLAAYVKASFKATRYGIIAGQGISLIQKLSGALLLWWGVTLVLEGKLTPGELVAFNMLSGHVTQPILRLAQIWQDFQHTLISLRRVGDILDEPGEASTGGLASMPSMAGQVEFQGVRFRYQEDAPEVLRNLNVAIQAGEFVGITGPSGSGKSTLTKLLQRLYTPQSGQVMVDGVDLAIADPVQLRRRMSVVLQESVLFTGSVAENIRWVRPEASDDEVVQVARQAGAHEFIQGLGQGYATQVGERGARLSGGQRQRIALARALLSDPQILILDEATSALDYESEAAILVNMDSICQGRTVLSIAHRLSTIRHADRILVVDKGEIVEQGHHDDLLRLQGVYAELWNMQVD